MIPRDRTAVKMTPTRNVFPGEGEGLTQDAADAEGEDRAGGTEGGGIPLTSRMPPFWQGNSIISIDFMKRARLAPPGGTLKVNPGTETQLRGWCAQPKMPVAGGAVSDPPVSSSGRALSRRGVSVTAAGRSGGRGTGEPFVRISPQLKPNTGRLKMPVLRTEADGAVWRISPRCSSRRQKQTRAGVAMPVLRMEAAWGPACGSPLHAARSSLRSSSIIWSFNWGISSSRMRSLSREETLGFSRALR
jgi:hypothetical protein